MYKPGDRIFTDLEALKADLEAEDPQEGMGDDPYKAVFLGSIFSLTPSGKFYAPFACSNVDACPVCKGSGSVGAHKKKRIRKKAGKRYQQLMDRARNGSRDKAIAEYPQRQRYQRMSLGTSCTFCAGMGSREAYLDECWREQAEAELDTIGAWLEGGEGDPCDLFACMHADQN